MLPHCPVRMKVGDSSDTDDSEESIGVCNFPPRYEIEVHRSGSLYMWWTSCSADPYAVTKLHRTGGGII